MSKNEHQLEAHRVLVSVRRSLLCGGNDNELPLCPVLNWSSPTDRESKLILPECRGVWLDRGELDKIIDRATGERPTSQWRSA
jgi:hypothetical protein